jgi:hypothetical protein
MEITIQGKVLEKIKYQVNSFHMMIILACGVANGLESLTSHSGLRVRSPSTPQGRVIILE